MRRIFPILLTILLFSSSLVYSDGHSVGSGTTFRIGVPPVEPLNNLSPDGEVSGLFPDLIREAFAESELIPVFVGAKLSECIELLHNDKIDLVTTVRFSSQDAEILDYSVEPVAIIWGQVFCRVGSQFNNIMELNEKTVALMRNDVVGENFLKSLASFGGKCKVLECNNHLEVMASVHSGTALAGVAPQYFGQKHAASFNLVETSIPFFPFAVYFATSKGKNRPLLDLLDLKIKDWKNDSGSFYYQRLSHWLGQGVSSNGSIPTWLKVFLWLLVAIALASLLFNRFLNLCVQEKTRELLERDTEFHEIVESANSIILRLNKNKQITFMNHFGLELFGFTAEELIGKSIVGTIVPGKPSEEKDLPTTVQGAFAQPEAYIVSESENQCKDGRKLFIQWSNRAIYDDKGHFVELLCIGTDVTKRKALEAELLQAQKMEAIGRLAGGIAHDFNNILFIIFGNAELARLNVGDPVSLNENLDQVVSSAERARDLVKQILAFSRKESTAKKVLSLVEVVREAAKMIRSTFPATIKIVEEYDSNHQIIADHTQIYQIIMNLCTNSMHAIEGGHGELKIRISEGWEFLDCPDPLAEGAQKSEVLKLEIADTGKGIRKENIEKIFEPFFTTKEKNKGTGMGLAVVHGIVKEHGGDIRVFSEEGKGTRFELIFPLVRAEEKGEAKVVKGDDLCGSERIMLIDDEQGILDAVGSILRGRGYVVSTFRKPQKALIAFDKNPENYDLIITDLTMPGITGEMLTRIVLEKVPGFPVFLITGHSEEIDAAAAYEFGVKAFAYKPLSSEELLKEVRAIFSSSSERRHFEPVLESEKSFEVG